jgi:hypothetical protein
MMGMLDKKTNQDEISLDINYIKNSLNKYIKEFKSTKDD